MFTHAREIDANIFLKIVLTSPEQVSRILVSMGINWNVNVNLTRDRNRTNVFLYATILLILMSIALSK